MLWKGFRCVVNYAMLKTESLAAIWSQYHTNGLSITLTKEATPTLHRFFCTRLVLPNDTGPVSTYSFMTDWLAHFDFPSSAGMLGP